MRSDSGHLSAIVNVNNMVLRKYGSGRGIHRKSDWKLLSAHGDSRHIESVHTPDVHSYKDSCRLRRRGNTQAPFKASQPICTLERPSRRVGQDQELADCDRAFELGYPRSMRPANSSEVGLAIIMSTRGLTIFATHLYVQSC